MTYLFTLDLTCLPALPPSADRLTLTSAYGQPVVYGSDGMGIFVPTTEIGKLPDGLNFCPLPLTLALLLASARHNRAAVYGYDDYLLLVSADRLYLCSDDRLIIVNRAHVSYGRGVVAEARRRLAGAAVPTVPLPGLLLVTIRERMNSPVHYLFIEEAR